MIAILGLAAGQVDAQNGGYGTFKFLKYTNSARIAGLVCESHGAMTGIPEHLKF